MNFWRNVRSMMRASMWIGVMASWLITGPSSVEAQDREAARAAFQAGVAAYGEERYEEALEAFQNAHRIAPHPTVRINLANTFEQLNRPVEALDQFERFLVEADDAHSAQREEVRAAIARLEANIAEVFLRIEPDGATVTIDDQVTLRAPILEAQKLTAGPHTFRVTRPGFAPYEQRIDLQGGDRREVEITLQAASGEVAEVETTDGLAAGPTIEETEEESDSGGGFRLTTPVIVLGGAAVALGITAAVLGITALGADSDFEDAVTRSNDPSLSAAERSQARQDGLDAADRANRRSVAADVLGITAAAAGAGAVVFLFLSRDSGDERATRVSPQLGPSRAGLAVRGAF